jgi:hypothetical protein
VIASDSRFLPALQKFSSFSNRVAATEAVSPSSGEEVLGTRPTYVFQATPHPGCHASGKYGKMSAKSEGELWIDKSDFGWIKVGGQVTQSSSMGLFAARVQRGSHILEQKNVGDAVCASKRQNPFPKEPRHGKDIFTYSDYRPQTDGPHSARK